MYVCVTLEDDNEIQNLSLVQMTNRAKLTRDYKVTLARDENDEKEDRCGVDASKGRRAHFNSSLDFVRALTSVATPFFP